MLKIIQINVNIKFQQLHPIIISFFILYYFNNFLIIKLQLNFFLLLLLIIISVVIIYYHPKSFNFILKEFFNILIIQYL